MDIMGGLVVILENQCSLLELSKGNVISRYAEDQITKRIEKTTAILDERRKKLEELSSDADTEKS